jgi:hypothetical protein
VGGQRHTSAALPPWKTRCPLYRRHGGPQDRSGLLPKILLPPGFDPRTVQPMGSCYTDWAISAYQRTHILYKSRCSHTLSWTSLRNSSHVVVQGCVSYIFTSSMSGFSSFYTPMLCAYQYVSGTYYEIHFLNSVALVYRLPVEFMEPFKMCFPYFLLLLCITALFCGVCLGCEVCLFP